MAYISINLDSVSLGMQTGVTVIIPDDPINAGKKLPVLWLLHGGMGGHMDWTRYTRIELYAKERGIAVVMPGVQNCFYVNMLHGDDYYTYVARELPVAMRAMFPVFSADPGENYIAGLSMGGYGAVMIGMKNPRDYAAIITLSGGVNLDGFYRDQLPGVNLEDVFGTWEQYHLSDNDPIAYARRARAAGAEFPPIYQACGLSDFGYRENVGFRDQMLSLGCDLTYEEGPGGHDWYFWDTYIVRALDWIKEKLAAPQA